MLHDVGDCVQHLPEEGTGVESSRVVLNGLTIKLILQGDELINCPAYAFNRLVFVQHAGGRLVRVEVGRQ